MMLFAFRGEMKWEGFASSFYDVGMCCFAISFARCFEFGRCVPGMFFVYGIFDIVCICVGNKWFMN